MSNQEFTFIVKAFMRPRCLERLLLSVRSFYPDIRIIVADDSRHITKTPRVKHDLIKLPYDSGEGYGRQALMQKIDTPYFVQLDDDFIFSKKTRVELLVDIAKRCGHDIVGGGVYQDLHTRHLEGLLEKQGTELYFRRGFHENHGDHRTCDYVMLFCAGNTETVRRHGWDARFKIGGAHEDFFWRGKGRLSVAYCPKVVVKHDPIREMEYMDMRVRGHHYTDMFMKKHGFTALYPFEQKFSERIGHSIRRGKRLYSRVKKKLDF